MKNEKLAKLIVILGPTASGKTDLAIKLAKKFNGEIVSADSRQIYKKMIIGTASPCQQMQNVKCKNQNDNPKFKNKIFKKSILIKGVPHYLLHIVSPNEEFNVAIYKKLAIKIIKDIQGQGKLPFLVGGTGLYIQAVVDNIEFPKVPPQKKLRKKLQNLSTKKLFKIYQKLDPRGAKFIEKENKRRLIRAIEVCKITKKPYSQLRKRGEALFEVLEIGIKISKNELKKRVEKRVNEMIKIELEKEVRSLVKKYGLEIPPMQTIGYQEWSSFVKTSEDKKRIFFSFTKSEKEKIKYLIKLHSLQFAKRQITWFKKDKRIHWIPFTHHLYKHTRILIKEFLKKTKKRR